MSKKRASQATVDAFLRPEAPMLDLKELEKIIKEPIYYPADVQTLLDAAPALIEELLWSRECFERKGDEDR